MNFGKHRMRQLVEAIRLQKAVGRDQNLAKELAQRVRVVRFRRNQPLIRQDGTDNSLYFLLSGTVAILVNGREVGTRASGEHVGEMSLIEPGARRSATVLATTPTIAARITEAAFTAVADRYPDLWRSLAVELARRLRQRGRFHAPRNRRPILFIGSSKEGLPIATSVFRQFKSGTRVKPLLWSDGVFGASRFPVEDLERQLKKADFAVLVARGDDVVRSRHRQQRAPRDNVILELGLFMGAISRHRTFLIAPRGVDVKIPTDLLGLTLLRCEPHRRVTIRTTAKACRELRQTIAALGAK